MSFALKIGADPELFIKRKTNKRSFSSAHGIIPGTKQNPHPVNKGAVQVDGMALEFNIDPASTAEEFLDNITTVVSELRGMVPGSFEFHFVPTARFTPKVMAAQPIEALEMGCESDYNAYTEENNPQPDATGKNYRTAGGHVHIGWTDDIDPNNPEHFEACVQFARHLDYYLGIGSILFDKDGQRRTLYGKPGCFRPKSYGMEYRTLSNAWLATPERIKWVFNTTKKAFNDLVEGIDPFKDCGELARDIIDRETHSDNCLKVARRILEELGVEDPSDL